jgi:hypothetical protein
MGNLGLNGGVTCGTEHRLSLKRYLTMTVMWTLTLAWLALQLPLAVLFGKSIKFSTVGYKKKRTPSRDPRHHRALSGARARLLRPGTFMSRQGKKLAMDQRAG